MAAGYRLFRFIFLQGRMQYLLGMSSTASAPNDVPHNAVPPLLRSACLLLAVLNAAMIPAMYLAHAWLFDARGRGRKLRRR